MITVQTRNQLLNSIPRGGAVAELGVFKGAFAEAILFTCQPNELHLIDTWSGCMVSGDKDGKDVQTVPDMSLVYEKLQMRYERDMRVHLHRGTTTMMLSRFADHYFNFIYIDADHSYKGVAADLWMASQKLAEGGILGGHDYCAMFPGTVQAVDEFCAGRGSDGIPDWEMTHLTQDGCPSYLLRRVA